MRTGWASSWSKAVACLLLVLGTVRVGIAYSVLTHEEVIDLLWNDQIAPMLMRRYPGTTPDELRQAHAFAYGGSMIQDMGYYPFGNKHFSDLVHYVRSGDFVENLISEASNLDEYAFALGALAHYAADTTGHPTVNEIVAMQFPRLRARYGKIVTYAEDPKAHIRAEFGLDVEEVAKNQFRGDVYHDFIGFEVAKPVLERAFQKTYGIELKSIFTDLDLSIGSYRRAISVVIPKMTKAALVAHEKELQKANPKFNRKEFRYRLSRKQYEREWGKHYQKPSLGTRFLALLLRIVPKVGPLRAMAFNTPTPKEQQMYLDSLRHTKEEYRAVLAEAWTQHLNLPNKDFDTGKETRAGEYVLTDKTYARLLDELAKHHFVHLTPELRSDILEFYSNLNAPIATKHDKKQWERTVAELNELKSAPINAETAAPATGGQD
ncbi:MAG TPA: zinc dependent phospholipase C family protein [Terriglobales bacterium]|nr:zinc dependent phospholipase C family protein [Terriglobales bacterium]